MANTETETATVKKAEAKKVKQKVALRKKQAARKKVVENKIKVGKQKVAAEKKENEVKSESKHSHFADAAGAYAHITEKLKTVKKGQSFNLEAFTTERGKVVVYFQTGNE